MPDQIVLGWRQYRLERRMFWRNPSAAFFNFLLPLLFLAAGGAILSGSQRDLDKLVPSIAGLSVMSTTFTALEAIPGSGFFATTAKRRAIVLLTLSEQ